MGLRRAQDISAVIRTTLFFKTKPEVYRQLLKDLMTSCAVPECNLSNDCE